MIEEKPVEKPRQKVKPSGPSTKIQANRTSASGAPRQYLSQADVPAYSLEEALRVPRAIADEYAYRATPPLRVAAAMRLQPGSSTFKMLCGASIAYGLTKGGYNAPEIAVEPLGLRIVRPTVEGDVLNARRLALFKPRVIGEFLSNYRGGRIPREDIALNVLQDMGVPRDRVKAVFDLIMTGAETVGFIKEIKGSKYVDLEGAPVPVPSQEVGEAQEPAEAYEEERPDAVIQVAPVTSAPVVASLRPVPEGEEAGAGAVARRVFITHGKNKALVDPIRKLLMFGELEAVVSTERASVSQPVTDKVMGDMRSCGAAIIHADIEDELVKGEEKVAVLNGNVLIEIGAAMALYGRRFILLMKEGTKLPSNLQGAYEVRYEGNTLDVHATVRLIEAINDIKNHPIPGRYSFKKDH